ncbi:hypothetical protein COK56_25390 [Bacillus cereus]|nr:hypothetical protein COK56_25390 [Bacillus cereus]
MNLKIDKIDIEAFRAYKGLQTFDMKLNNEIADLIVIYAPNGFGKTTFFDAIEWGLTGKIQRITDNKRVREVALSEKGYILKNYDSDLHNGRVKITFSDNEVLEVKTLELNGSRKGDYRPGKNEKFTSKLTTIDKDTFIQKNLLTHDQIDKFLRFQTSKDRYDALKLFWDFNNDSETFINLVNLEKEIGNKKIELEEKIMDIKIFLKKFKISKDMKGKINEHIDAINKYLNKGSYLEKIDEKGENADEIIKKCLHIQSNNKQTLEELEARKNYLTYLIDNFEEEYQKKLTKKEELSNGPLKSLMKIQEELDLVQQAEIKKRAIVKEIEGLNKDLYEIKFLIKYYEEHQNNLKKIKLLEDNSETFLSKRKDISTKFIEIKNQIYDTKKERDLTSIEREKQESKLSQCKQLEEYWGTNNKIEAYKKLVHKVNQEMLEVQGEISKIEEEIDWKLNFIENGYSSVRDENILKNSPNKFIQINKDISDLNKEIKKLKQTIANKEQTLEGYKKLGTDISQLKKIGYDIVRSSRSSLCPLCNKDYKEFDKLIEIIDNTSNDLINIQDIKNEIEDCNLVLQDLKTKVINKESELNHFLKENIQLQREETEKLVEKKNEKFKHYSRLKEEYDFLENRAKIEMKLLSKLNLLAFPQNERKSELIQNIEILEGKIEELKNLDKRFENRIDKLRNTLNNTQKNLDLLEASFKQNQLEKENILNSEKSLKMNKILGKFNIDHLNQVDIISSNLKNSIYVLKRKLVEFEENIELTVNTIGDITKEELESKINNIVNKIEDQTKGIKAYEAILIQCFGTKDVELQQIQHSIAINKNQIEEYKIQYRATIEVINTLDAFFNNSIKKEKENEEKRLIIESRYILKVYDELVKTKITSYNFIKEKIIEVLNLDTINKIYQMIEPHPKFKSVGFKLDETLKDGLGLNIVCNKDNDEKGAVPTLYLSSAQINILSLSIFLANAMRNKSGINVILMDDPIQHLDGLNILSFIDLIRMICFMHGIQMIISTHDERFFKLIQKKIDSKYFNAKYITLTSSGVVKTDNI